MLGAAGAMAYLRLGRAEDPGFTIKVMVVTAQWPGATAAEMQEHVADPIESRLQDLPFLDRVETFTRPGQAVMTVVLRDTTPPRQVQALWYQVRKKVGDIRHTLPGGVQGPFFDDEYSDVWSAIYAVTGADNAELVRQAEALRARLLRVPGVDKVKIFGEQPQRIHVEVAHARLASLGLQPQAVIDALARHNPVDARPAWWRARRRGCTCAWVAASRAGGDPRRAGRGRRAVAAPGRHRRGDARHGGPAIQRHPPGRRARRAAGGRQAAGRERGDAGRGARRRDGRRSAP